MTAPRTKVARRSAQDIAVIREKEPTLLPLTPEGHRERPDVYAKFLATCLAARDALAERKP